MKFLADKTEKFAVQIISIYKYLKKNGHYELASQLVRSGTSIGALVREAKYAQSRADLISKYTIALKEANETIYWLTVMKKAGLLNDIPLKETEEILKILISTIKSLKSHN